LPRQPIFNSADEKLVPLFAYGTLRDADTLLLVVKNSDHLVFQPAVLQGWRAVFWRGRSYPGVIPDPAGSVDGELISGLTAVDWQNLITYEGEAYSLEICRPSFQGKIHQAWIFMPCHYHDLTTHPWTLDDWQRFHKNSFDIEENS